LSRIITVCDKLHVNFGGLGRVVLNRSQLLMKKGYDVVILTIEDDNDYSYIEKELKRNGHLESSISIINIYEYFRDLNTDLDNLVLNETELFVDKYEDGYHIIDDPEKNGNTLYFCDGYLAKKKIWNDDGSLKNIDYYNENGIQTRRELYFDGYLYSETLHIDDDIIRKRFFTKDGYCFLSEFVYCDGEEKSILLFNRDENKVEYFSDEEDFHKNFITEIIKSRSQMPFLICDSSGPSPSISNIDPNIAYKIGQLHSNPYNGPYSFGGPIRNIGILKDPAQLDALVTLTENQRKDIIKEFGDLNNTYTIPNFVPSIGLKEINKKNDKISIFTRFSPEKNIPDAIRAFHAVVKKRGNAKLEIYARASSPEEIMEKEKVQNLIKELKLEKNVNINGYIQDVNTEMADSIVTLITSKFEGFPMVMIESMLNTTPVISYDLNYGPDEVIENGIDGFIVEYGNLEKMAERIIELLDDVEKAKKLGLSARKKIFNSYTDTVIIKKWENLLKTIPETQRKKIKNLYHESKKKDEISLQTVLHPLLSKAENEENLVEVLEYKIDILEENIYEMEYLKNKSFIQKLLSFFYPFQILLNKHNDSLKTAVLNIKGYRAIKKYDLFRIGFYLKNNDDVRRSGADPLLHYILHGYKEGRKPSPTFDGEKYMSKYKDVKDSNINPLIHYSLFGIKEGRN
jgi:glycosyltransferase involved in cell wall biosynthesis